MTATDPKQQAISDPCWLAHRYDASVDAFQFRHVSRPQHRSATFLTDEYLGEADRLIPVSRQQSATGLKDAASQPASALHFVFHSAFCASTMLVRALDVPGMAMGLSEPMLCNDMIGWLRRGADRRQLAAVLGSSLDLLARPFEPGEAVVVKPSNIFNPLIEASLALRPASNAVLLYAPLDVFLLSVARKGLWCRLWARELLEGQLQDGLVGMDYQARDYFRMSDLQIAAIGWLAQQRLFRSLAEKLGPARIRTLDSETLIARAPEVLDALSQHFRLDPSAPQRSGMLSSPALATHSKFGHAFSADERAKESQNARTAHGEEIGHVLAWAKVVADQYGIALDLPNPLIN